MAASLSRTWIRKAIDLTNLPRIKLNNLQDLPGAKKKAVRVGRGPGSGRGKTSGRGHKGQGQRNKKAIRVGFEGGQTPFYLRVPKRGFTNIFHKEYVPLNVGTLQWYIDNGRIDPSKPIDMHTLKKAGVAKKIKHGIKLLGNGSHLLTSQLNIEVSRASKKAIEAVEANGGRIVTAYYNRLGLRVLLSPEKFEGKEIPRRALPSKHNMIYYLNPENRGYLLTEAGQKRLAEGGMEGAYLHPDGRVAIPGKKTTLYTGIAPTKAEAYKEVPVEKNIPEEFNWQ